MEMENKKPNSNFTIALHWQRINGNPVGLEHAERLENLAAETFYNIVSSIQKKIVKGIDKGDIFATIQINSRDRFEFCGNWKYLSSECGRGETPDA